MLSSLAQQFQQQQSSKLSAKQAAQSRDSRANLSESRKSNTSSVASKGKQNSTIDYGATASFNELIGGTEGLQKTSDRVESKVVQ